MGEEAGRREEVGEGRRSSANRKWRLVFKQAVVWIPSCVCVIPHPPQSVCVCACASNEGIFPALFLHHTHNPLPGMDRSSHSHAAEPTSVANGNLANWHVRAIVTFDLYAAHGSDYRSVYLIRGFWGSQGTSTGIHSLIF